MSTVTAVSAPKISGGSFLIGERAPDDVFTPEDFTEQQAGLGLDAPEFLFHRHAGAARRLSV